MSNKNNMSELVRRAQGGDSAAFNQLFSSCYNDIYYFALKTVKREDLAYDITQEACIDIFKNISSLQDPNMFVAWSKRITYNRCAQYFRKNHEILVDENEDGTDIFDTIEDEDRDFIPDEALDRDDFRLTIMNMINGLSEEQRTAVMLYYFDELSVGEIAQIQGVSEGTVKSRLNYARKSIKSAVEDYEDKNGIKLHSFGLLPLLLWLRGGDMGSLSIPSAGAGLQATISGLSSVGATAAATAATSGVSGSAVTTGGLASGGSASTSGAIATGGAASITGTTSAATVATTTAATAGKGILAKIIAAIVAASVVIGGSFIAYREILHKRDETHQTENDKKDKKPSDDTADSTEADTENPVIFPDDYISEKLEVYGTSYDFRDQIVKYIVNGNYFVTKDGKIYNLLTTTEPEAITISPDHVYSLYSALAYVNEERHLVAYGTGADALLPDLDHKVIDIYDTGLISSYLDVITKDSSGNLYYTSFVKEDMSTPVKCVPIVVYDNSTEAMASKVIDIEICYNPIYDDDYVYIVTEDMIYLTNSRQLSEDGSQFIFYGNPITDKVEGIIDSPRSEDDFSPFYVKDGNDINIYRYKDATLSGGEYAIPLPEGYVASQVEKVIPAYHTWIITFSDGSVYTYNGAYTRIDYLSDLYSEGHIKDFYLYNQNIWNDEYDIVLWMADNGLYKYIW